MTWASLAARFSPFCCCYAMGECSGADTKDKINWLPRRSLQDLIAAEYIIEEIRIVGVAWVRQFLRRFSKFYLSFWFLIVGFGRWEQANLLLCLFAAWLCAAFNVPVDLILFGLLWVKKFKFLFEFFPFNLKRQPASVPERYHLACQLFSDIVRALCLV